MYKFNGKRGYYQWEGAPAEALPEHNFEISFDFRTSQKQIGLFNFGNTKRGGHDREIGLKNGRPYVRVWKGHGWLGAAPKGKSYHDGKWHHLRLTVVTKVGQTLYLDGKKVGTNKYDHSDFNWS